MSTEPEKVLCVVSAPLGDCVCVLPKIRFLAERHGRPVDILAKPLFLPDLYDGVEYIDRIFPVRHWKFWPALLFRMLPLLKREKYGHIYFLAGQQHKREFRWVFRFAGHLQCQIKWGVPEEILEAGRRPGFMSPLALPVILTATDREREDVRRLLSRACGWNGEPLILCHPGSSYAVYAADGKCNRKRPRNLTNTRQWPAENWRKTIAGVEKSAPEAFLLVTGSARERGLAEEILAGLSGRVASLAGLLSIRQLLAIQSMAHSCIAIDTGAAHTAMAVGCPTVVLYDYGDPRVTRAQCSPKGWGPVITVRGFRNHEELTVGGCREPIKNIRPETVVRLWETLPLRPPEPPRECFVAHYCEGDGEPEILPLLYY